MLEWTLPCPLPFAPFEAETVKEPAPLRIAAVSRFSTIAVFEYPPALQLRIAAVSRFATMESFLFDQR